MASKRKRDIEESMASPNAKQMKLDEVTRSGRVRKKPAKFTDHGGAGDADIKPDIAEKSQILPDLEQISPAEVPDPITIVVPVTPAAVKYESEPEWKDDPLDDDLGKSGNRSSRARKKSAKVLEMEEFEEAEKKHTVKKDGKKLKSSPVHGVTILQSASGSAMVKPTSPIPILKIKDIPTGPKVETMSPVNVQMSAHKLSVGSAKSATSAVKKSPESGKSPGGGSVIKLLLNSPTQSASLSVSTTSLSQSSPPPESKPQSASKKSKAKAKSVTISSPEAKPLSSPKIKQQLMQSPPPAGTVQIQPGVVAVKHRTVKSPQPSIPDISKDGLEIETVVETSIQTTAVKEIKTKKGSKKTVVKDDDSPFLSPPLPSANVIHVGSHNVGLEISAKEDSPETAFRSSGSGKKTKKDGKVVLKMEQAKLDMSEAMMDEDFGLDMPEIELGDTGDDSFMEMDDEDSLMIPEEEVETEKPKKVGKKKPGKAGGKSKIQLGDVPNTDAALVMDFARMKPEEKKSKKALKLMKEEMAEMSSNKKKRAPTAYMLWCAGHRPKLVYENPGIDFSTISKTLGEMWSNLSEKEKMVWKRKAKKAAGKGSTLITTGKGGAAKAAPQITTARQAAAMSQKSNPALAQALLATKQMKPAVDDLNTPIKGFGMDPVDVAAHLKIVGESLSIIGMKLQEHRGLIAVQGSLSVLLDSMLCAVAPLMCLTAVLPETNGLPPETHMNTLDNIAYIMPGL